MKVVVHDSRPKINEVTLSSDPLIVWLSPKIELRIRRGDTIQKVLLEVKKQGWFASDKTLRKLIAYWFALGERFARGEMSKPWRKEERRSEAERAYLYD